MKNTLLVAVLAGFFCSPSFASNPYADYRARTYDLQETYLKSVADHQARVMRDMEEKLAQQKWQTNAIAVMVFVMVGTGLFLSYLQFRRDAEPGRSSSVSLKLGPGQVEIASSVIGLAILALSFWFFQTYVDRVYSVEIFKVPPFDFTTFGINQ